MHPTSVLQVRGGLSGAALPHPPSASLTAIKWGGAAEGPAEEESGGGTPGTAPRPLPHRHECTGTPGPPGLAALGTG